MPVEILMPALSPTMTEGKLARWLKSEGDDVSAGDVIAEIETDKATMEVEAVDDGVLASILVADGSDGVAVGTVIARLAEDGEAVEDVASTAVPPPAPVSPAPVSDASEASAASQTDAVSADRVPAVAAPVQTSAVAAVAAPKAPATSADGSRIFASPLARRIAADRGIDLARLSGSGPHGRILRRQGHVQAQRRTRESVAAVG